MIMYIVKLGSLLVPKDTDHCYLKAIFRILPRLAAPKSHFLCAAKTFLSITVSLVYWVKAGKDCYFCLKNAIFGAKNWPKFAVSILFFAGSAIC